MIDVSRCTKHERKVLVAALAQYRARQDRHKRDFVESAKSAEAGANSYVASDLLLQVDPG